MKKPVVALMIVMMSSASAAVGLGGPMRDANDGSNIYSYDEETKRYERCPGSVKPGWSYGDPERSGEATSVRRELNGDVAVKRRGGSVEEVWTEASPGRWERKY